MGYRILLHEIKLRNVLSYGPEGQKLALGRLNVLIGPNGGGKTNFLDVFGFLKALPSPDVSSLIAQTGGIDAWLWKGNDVRQCGVTAFPPPDSGPVGNRFAV